LINAYDIPEDEAYAQLLIYDRFGTIIWPEQDAFPGVDYHILHVIDNSCDRRGDFDDYNNSGSPFWYDHDKLGSPALIIFELTLLSDESVVRYAYFPIYGAGTAQYASGFYHPTPTLVGGVDLGVSVIRVDDDPVVDVVRTYPYGTDGNPTHSFEHVYAGGPFASPYVWNHWIGTDSNASSFANPPNFFLARLLESDDVSDWAQGSAYGMAAEIDTVVPIDGDVNWDPDNMGVSGLDVLFPEDVRMFVRNGLDVVGTTLTAVDPGEQWGGIVVAAGDGLVELGGGSVVEHAAAGVVVYAPARVEFDGATLRDNTVGLAVYADGSGGQPGALVEDTEISDNWVGISTDYTCTWDSGPGPTCSQFVSTPSLLRVIDAAVHDNTGFGIYALNSDVAVLDTEISLNGQGGIAVANATILPFQRNTVTENGASSDGYGVSVLSAGDFRLSPATELGENDVLNNATTEVWVFNGGEAFFGDAATNGFNEVYDTGGGLLVRYPSGGKALDAAYQWLGASGGPNPSTAFSGPVEYCPYLTCDPDVNPNCTPGCSSSLQPEPGGATRSSMVPVSGGVEYGILGNSFVERLRARMQRVRTALADDPSAPGSVALVRELGSLHRLDPEDSTGEGAATASLLSSLRQRLTDPTIATGARAVAEAALEVESLAALKGEGYGEATSLIDGYASLVEGERVRQQLALVRAFLLARENRRPEARALVEGVASSAQEPGEVRELSTLAAMLGGATAGGSLTSGGPVAVLANVASETGTESGRLIMAPNPSAGPMVVTLALSAHANARLAVFDLLGREVAVLGVGALPAGTHSFDLNGARLPAGTYLVRAVLAPDEGVPQTLTQRLVLIERR